MGKVHGSLARAGKVKNQTPKVAASKDKKKKLAGRAGLREKYNRRVLATNAQPGDKMKMNPQAPGKMG